MFTFIFSNGLEIVEDISEKEDDIFFRFTLFKRKFFIQLEASHLVINMYM